MRRIPRADVAGISVVFVALLVWWLRIVHLFPQVEFIDWITSPVRPMFDDSIKAMASFRDDAFSRHVSLMWASVIGRTCGTNISCINTLAFAPVAGAAFAFYGFARLLRLSAAVATAIVLIWLISTPTFEVLTWQATLHDRLAAVFVPLLLMATLTLVQRADWRPIALPVASVLLAIFAMLTVNTKEPAWIVVPMLAAAPAMLATTRRQAAAAVALVAPAVLVTAVHVVTDMRALAADPASADHVGSGSIRDNLPQLTSHALPGGLWLLAVLLVPAIVGLFLAVRCRVERPEALTAARQAAWLGVGAVVGLAIPARTQFASAFYMFLPLMMAALALACAYRALLIARPPTNDRVRTGIAVAVGALTAWCIVVSLADRWHPYGQIVANDKNFRASTKKIAELHRRNPGGAYQFRMAYFGGYRYVTAAPATHFWRLLGSTINEPDGRTMQTSVPEECGVGGVIILRYDENSHFLGTCPTLPSR